CVLIYAVAYTTLFRSEARERLRTAGDRFEGAARREVQVVAVPAAHDAVSGGVDDVRVLDERGGREVGDDHRALEVGDVVAGEQRSEEHTSELQSRENL